MKKLLIFLFLSPFLSFSQIPNGVSYQAVATDLNGVELVNQNISIKASILSGTVTGNQEYVEEHNDVPGSQAFTNFFNIRQLDWQMLTYQP